MADPDGRHVFVSYVREDSDEVDGLCAVLEAAQIPYWRDRSALGPGDAWRAKIRQAIRDGSLVFLACFSDRSRAKDRSYMNEELTLAVDQFRSMPPGRTWLIPVRFDSGDVPEWDLGAGRTLSDLNFSDLFGDAYPAEAVKLVTTIRRLMGDKPLDSASTLAAIEHATVADRTQMLRRLTKEMLLDPAQRIALDDLVRHDVQRLESALKDSGRVAGLSAGSSDKQVLRVVREAQELWDLSRPFCASLEVAARWGSPDSLAPWTGGVRSLVASANKVQGGVEALLKMRHLPGVLSIMTAGLACVPNRQWGNLRALVVDPTVRDRYQQRSLSLLEATDPFAPFDYSGLVANTLARAALQGKSIEEALGDITERREGKYHTPVAEWLHASLRPLFAEQWPDEDAFAAEFDRTEVMLGVLAQDAALVRTDGASERQAYARSRWFGRSTWRSSRFHGSPVDELRDEFESAGASWGPLRAGLFGGDERRARAALERYNEDFQQVAQSRMF